MALAQRARLFILVASMPVIESLSDDVPVATPVRSSLPEIIVTVAASIAAMGLLATRQVTGRVLLEAML